MNLSKTLLLAATLAGSAQAFASPLYLLVEGTVSNSTYLSKSAYGDSSSIHTDEIGQYFQLRVTMDTDHMGNNVASGSTDNRYGSTSYLGLYSPGCCHGSSSITRLDGTSTNVGPGTDLRPHVFWSIGSRPEQDLVWGSPDVTEAQFLPTVALEFKSQSVSSDHEVGATITVSQGLSTKQKFDLTLRDATDGLAGSDGYLFDWAANGGNFGVLSYVSSWNNIYGGYHYTEDTRTVSLHRVALSSTPVAETPVPGMAWLFGAACGGLIARARRRVG